MKAKTLIAKLQEETDKILHHMQDQPPAMAQTIELATPIELPKKRHNRRPRAFVLLSQR